ncbi:MAG: hypothetical protein COV47_05385 [Candidatus Diapherotrites archaeon CG11_big_fil_rev_8_21_14_0_20_37_9]|nr:MAG: hypothetical protein COV47_05385 [Candidatus Diapherotrites archaeon CG11_big_fil_rev_8_21_14_0_20_37_9]
MGETLVRMEGAQELIVDKLTKNGLYKTRSEVIRAGVLELAEKHKLFKNAKELEDELAVKKMQKISEEISKGKLKTQSWQEVKKKYNFK